MEAGDLVAATEAAGATRPAAGEDHREWLLDISLEEAAVGFPMGLGTHFSRDTEGTTYGFTVADVDRYVETVPPGQHSVITLREGAELRSDLPVKDGYRVSQEGAPGDPVPLEDAGRLGPSVVGLSQRDRDVAVSQTEEGITRWLEEEGSTLADDESVAGIARVADDADAYSLSLFARGDRAGQGPSGEAATISPCFEGVGVALAATGGQTRSLVVYHFPDGVDGQEDQVRAAWADSRSFNGVDFSSMLEVSEVRTEDDLVVAELTIGDDQRPGLVRDMLRRDEAPFACEG